MSGPALTIELAEPVPPAALGELRALMLSLSSHFEEKRPGFFDVNVAVERLGVEDEEEEDWRRPFLVHLMGPGVGDEDLFEVEHSDQPEVEAVLGFKPTHSVDVLAGCGRRIDHVATALLTAAVVDVIGGVVNAELSGLQAPVVAGLPGVLGITEGRWPLVLGTADFLRSWARHPAFRLFK